MSTNFEFKKEQTKIRHTFTDRERSDLGQALASAFDEKRRLEEERKSINTDYKAKIQETEARITGLSSRVSSGFEMIPTMCLVVIDRSSGVRRFYPVDTDRENISEVEPLKEETLPAGYQVEIDDVFIEAKPGGAIDVAIDTAFEGDPDPGQVDDRPTVVVDTYPDADPGDFPEDNPTNVLNGPEDDLAHFSPDEEPDVKKQGREVWLMWLIYLIKRTRDLYAPDAEGRDLPRGNEYLLKDSFSLPSIAYLADCKTHALNRVRNWGLAHIRAAEPGADTDESHKLPALPSVLESWELATFEPYSTDDLASE